MKPIDPPWTTLVDVATLAAALGDGVRVVDARATASTVRVVDARASLADPQHLFNASLEGKVRRAIDIREGEEIDAQAFKDLVREAAALNEAAARKRSPKG